jgi:2-phosphosulfolactate phosphatase
VEVSLQRPSQLGRAPIDVAVVIDVLRATSTAAVLLSRGAKELVVLATPDELSLLPEGGGPYLYVSEMSRLAQAGERIDNSPALAATLELGARTPVLITTNGTRALDAAAAKAGEVLAASFLNVSAVAAHLAQSGAGRVALVPAGDFANDDVRAEDDRCAEALQKLLLGERPGLSALAHSCRQDPRVVRRLAKEPTFAADLELCLLPDTFPVVMHYVASRVGHGWLRKKN